MYIFPKEGWSDVVVRRYADAYHPMSSSDSNAVVIEGIAVAKSRPIKIIFLSE